MLAGGLYQQSRSRLDIGHRTIPGLTTHHHDEDPTAGLLKVVGSGAVVLTGVNSGAG